MFNRISMIGLGYIGLPTATLFAAREKQVIGVDLSQHAVDTINAGASTSSSPNWTCWCMPPSTKAIWGKRFPEPVFCSGEAGINDPGAASPTRPQW